MGKTTLGRQLSKEIRWSFLDTDTLLEKRHNSTLQELIDSKNHSRFCQFEQEVLLSLDYENHIIATGGSAVYGNSAMIHLGKIGLIVYLEIALCELEKRLSNYSSRGVANPSGSSFSDLYEERIPLYRRYADVTISCGDQPSGQIIHKLLASI